MNPPARMQTQGRIQVITIDAQQRRNALTSAMTKGRFANWSKR